MVLHQTRHKRTETQGRLGWTASTQRAAVKYQMELVIMKKVLTLITAISVGSNSKNVLGVERPSSPNGEADNRRGMSFDKGKLAVEAMVCQSRFSSSKGATYSVSQLAVFPPPVSDSKA